VEAGVRAAGRDPSQFQFSAGIFVGPGEDPRDERVIGGSQEEIADALAGYRAAGCDHAILNFAPAPFAEVDPSHPARLAPLLDRFR
jgi:alkanesulfonate monooxygenase SsuD/methylene tetrahydromethanopterin reductase-like flavin-dependent oxidoreductase (luciferase family)